MKEFFKNNWHIFLIEGFVLLAFVIFYGQFGDVNVDSFREAYIPEQILAGKALYKNIFTIYSPLAYQINALLFLIFGIHLKTLYFAGLFSTMGIFYLTYKIARRFMDANLPLAICLFIISALVLSPNVFNPFFPYSYGLLYGVLFILLSMYSVLNRRFSLAYLFYSFAICSKYEFLFLLPLIIYAEKRRTKTFNWKKNIPALLVPIIISLTALNGAGIQDILTSFGLIITMGATKTLYWFYSSMGLSFRPELIPIYIINFIKFLVPVYWVKYQEIVVWIMPAIAILFILRYKKINFLKKFFIFGTLLVSAKVFCALTLQAYGVFFLPFALISLGILTPHKFRNGLAVLLLIWAIVVGGQNISALNNKDVEVKTSRGIIKTSRYNGRALNKLITYIEKTDKDAKVVVYPEGLCANFLTDRDSDSKFYSLIPLYVETFGEQVIISRLEKIMPDYIVISDYNTSAYYYTRFGQDYAISIYDWIRDNYKLDSTIDGGMIFEVYKK